MRPSLILSVAMLSIGCQKNSEPAPTPDVAASRAVSSDESGAGGTAAPIDSQADYSAILAQLTQVLRKYSAENQKVPKTLAELVAAGYLPAAPLSPVGQRFVIDEKRLQVVLVK